MKTGLVLEGGGLRGIFTAGVLDVLMEEGIEFDGAVGVSAGAAFGSNYKSGQSRRAIRYNLRFAKDPRYSSIRSLLATGDLFNAQFCYHDIPEKLDPFDWDSFYKNHMEFYLVCTDVETGKPVYHLCEEGEDRYEALEWFRASGSMPLVSRIVEVGGQKLLDGGVADSIPLRFMEEQGYGRNLVILTRPANYVKNPIPLMTMVGRKFSAYPELVRAMAERHIMYNKELAYVRQREAGKYAFVIRPEEDLDIGRIEHDRFKIRTAYKEGRRLARRRLPEIRRFLAAAKKDYRSTSGSILERNPDEEPSAARPAAVKSAAAEPVAAEYMSAEPVGAETAATGSAAAEPAATKSAATESVATEPATAEPAATKSAEMENAEIHAGSNGTAVPEALERAEEPEALERAEESEALEGTEEPEDAAQTSGSAPSGSGNAFVLRSSRGNRQGKRWKPGKMASLKQRADENQRESKRTEENER